MFARLLPETIPVPDKFYPQSLEEASDMISSSRLPLSKTLFAFIEQTIAESGMRDEENREIIVSEVRE